MIPEVVLPKLWDGCSAKAPGRAPSSGGGPDAIDGSTSKVPVHSSGIPVAATDTMTGEPSCVVTLTNGSPMIGSETRTFSVTGPGPTTPEGEAVTAAVGAVLSTIVDWRFESAPSFPTGSTGVTA